MSDPRTTEYNQRGDVWRHSYAYHGEDLAHGRAFPRHRRHGRQA